MVNHDGHIDWLLSCNTLMCSEERRKGEKKNQYVPKCNHDDATCPNVVEMGKENARGRGAWGGQKVLKRSLTLS